jgi:hypothetical protein
LASEPWVWIEARTPTERSRSPVVARMKAGREPLVVDRGEGPEVLVEQAIQRGGPGLARAVHADRLRLGECPARGRSCHRSHGSLAPW